MSKKPFIDAIKSFDDRYYSLRLPTNNINQFGVALGKYIERIKKAETDGDSEETIKSIINLFLRDNFYAESQFEITAKNSIDSAIAYDDKLLALIETKRSSNTNEMVRENDINRKALWELTTYYLERTRDVTGTKVKRIPNVEVRRLIITDGLRWALIDAAALEKVCDGYLEQQYFKYKKNQLTYAKELPKFYQDIQTYFSEINITQKLDYLFLELPELVKTKRNWQYIYKLFQREYLLKFGFVPEVKSHELNDRFYQELLYLMGLRETQEDNKTIIKIDSSITNSLADQVYRKYRYDKERSENDAIEHTFELIIIWINRLLFIKLFEGQLIAFNSNDDGYHILDNRKIKDFQDLQNLFFEVLGRRNRADHPFYAQFEQIPYLNSSLFERQDIEKSDININELKNLSVSKKSRSILGSGAPKALPILQYIIDFLNSYSFSTHTAREDEEGIHAQEIIDASVLGFIFEKLNGYKDGSFYTPSAITEYMARETLELAILRSINTVLEWDCKTINMLKENLALAPVDIRRKADAAVNATRICDPAVGSGHFLVSALNRLIAIKKELGILFKHNSDERLVEVNILVENDILRVVDGQGRDFAYDKTNYLSQQVQETLFNEKKTLIENCLFGVDINVKAVSICTLRLWIELLKNAYYHQGIMETLPNIDINIKSGNSLIYKSRFEVGKQVGEQKIGLEKKYEDSVKKLIKQYKEQVRAYKSASDKQTKVAVHTAIKRIKQELYSAMGQVSIFDSSGPDYSNSMEWAFEFPETLSEEGVFQGFDCIIGNPPYIQLQKMKIEADSLKKMGYRVYARTGDIYCLFFELGHNLLSAGGVLSFVTSNKWMRAGYGEALRNFFACHTNPLVLIDFAGQKIFDSATVDVCIVMFERGTNQGQTESCIIKDKCLNNLSVYVKQNSVSNQFDASGSWTILSPIEQSIKRKIEAVGVPLKEWDVSIYRGVLTGYNEAFIIPTEKKNELVSLDPKSAEIIRPILRGRDIKRYEYSFADLWLISTFPSCHYDIDHYPAVRDYLLSLGKERLEQTGKEYIIEGRKVEARKRRTISGLKRKTA